MTQPTSINMTFDTSLVDLNTSFSTTESDPSSETNTNTQRITTTETPVLQQEAGSSSQETPKQSQTTLAPDTTPVQHLPTQQAYDQWAAVYDTDGNMLQAIDDLELATLLPSFLSTVVEKTTSPTDTDTDTDTDTAVPKPLHKDAPNRRRTLTLLDLGCGTGRNTAKLLAHAWPQDIQIHITGRDFSRAMLDQAALKLDPLARGTQNVVLKLEHADCFPGFDNSACEPAPAPPPAILAGDARDARGAEQGVHALISTLVLEHVPLTAYFATVSALLLRGGYALITNMHGDMGRISQAGFINAAGVKVRGQSYAHTVQDTIDEAKKAGFEVLSVKERRMERGDVESGRVGERGGKWIGVYVWYGIVLRKV